MLTRIPTKKDHRKKATQKTSAVMIMVCFYIFLVIERPWESISYLEGISIEKPYAILMIIMAVFSGKFRIVSSPTNKWVYGLLALHFMLAPFAFRPDFAFDQGIEYTKMIVLYLLMLAVVDNERSLKLLVNAFIFSMMLYAVHSLWEYHNGRHFFRMGIVRMIGVDEMYNDPNTFGASIVLSLPFVSVLLRTESEIKLKILYCVYFLIAIFCIVLTGSRSASVALVFLFFLWFLTQKGKKKFIILVVALLSIGIAWINMPTDKQNRIRSIWDSNAGPENAHASWDGRRLGLIAGWQMFKNSPFTGIGAGGRNFIGYRSQYLDSIPEQAHNLYAEVIGELGAIGAILFCGMIVSITQCCLRVIRFQSQNENRNRSFLFHLAIAIITSVLILLLLGIAGHNFYRPLWLWLAAWSGCIIVIQKK